VAAAGVLGVVSCKKNQDIPAQPAAIPVSPEDLSRDQSVVQLNDAMKRLDPQYLKLVFKDARTVQEITQQSAELFKEFSTDPDNAAAQQKLVDFYHFSSPAQMKQYSAAITESLKVLDQKYGLLKTMQSEKAGSLFFKARGALAKSRLGQDQGQRKQTTSIWLEFVEQYMSEFDYNTYVYDESLEASIEGGGGDICSFDLNICKATARNNFVANIAKYAGGGAVGGATVGGAFGTVVPALGTAAGIGIGFVWGGLAGTLLAINTYSNDLEICRLQYLKCLELEKNKNQ
jgi:hypothetical protein